MNDIIESLQNATNHNDQVYIVKYYNIYDDDSTEFIFGVTNSRHKALEFIKEHIRICHGCTSNRYSIESWTVNEFDKGGCTESFTKEQTMVWAKELGLCNE